MVKTVAALFDDSDDALSAAQGMRSAGFLDRDMKIAANAAHSSATARDSAEAVAIGVLCGSALGVLAGFAVTLLELKFPGLETIVAAGKLAPALLGAGVGAILGGLVGRLKDVAATRPDLLSRPEAVRRSASVLTVSADASRVDEAETIMRRHGGHDIFDRLERWKAPT